MPKTTAKVCQLNGTNYVTYKGTRYTVKDYNKKFKTRVYIPKNVKVCEPVIANQVVKLGKNKVGIANWDPSKPLHVEVDDIELPKLRKVEQDEMKEINRQIEMGWNRGFQFGLFWGIVGTLLALLIGTLLVLAYSR